MREPFVGRAIRRIVDVIIIGVATTPLASIYHDEMRVASFYQPHNRGPALRQQPTQESPIERVMVINECGFVVAAIVGCAPPYQPTSGTAIVLPATGIDLAWIFAGPIVSEYHCSRGYRTPRLTHGLTARIVKQAVGAPRGRALIIDRNIEGDRT